MHRFSFRLCALLSAQSNDFPVPAKNCYLTETHYIFLFYTYALHLDGKVF